MIPLKQPVFIPLGTLPKAPGGSLTRCFPVYTKAPASIVSPEPTPAEGKKEDSHIHFIEVETEAGGH